VIFLQISSDLEILLKKIEWDKYAVRPYPFFVWSFLLESYHSYENWLGSKFDFLMVFDAAFEKIYYRQSSKSKEMEQFIAERINDVSFWEKHVDRGDQELDRIFEEFSRYSEKDLSNYNDSELLQKFRGFCSDSADFIGLLSSLNLVVPALTDKLQKDSVQPKLAKLGKENELNQIMGLFSQSLGLSVYIEEETELLEVAEKKNSPEFEVALGSHVKKWEKMAFGSGHKLLTREQFLERITEAKEPEKLLPELKQKSILIEREIQNAVSLLGFDEKEKLLLKVIRRLLFQKTREDFILSLLEFIILTFFKEISKRKNISLDQAKMLTIDEAIAVLGGKRINEAELAERKKAALIIQFKNKQFVVSGEEAKKLHKRLIKDVAPTKFNGILKGLTGCPGFATGKVRLIQHLTHLEQLKQGEILVTASTNPAFVIAMKRAAAIVTDEGGITSHAAIVSREFRIPCVVGTKFATQSLQTGDFVEVDANNGIVKLIKSAE